MEKTFLTENPKTEEQIIEKPKKFKKKLHDNLAFYKFYKAQQMFKLHEFESMYHVFLKHIL